MVSYLSPVLLDVPAHDQPECSVDVLPTRWSGVTWERRAQQKAQGWYWKQYLRYSSSELAAVRESVAHLVVMKGLLNYQSIV